MNSINRVNNINFKAKFINPAIIKKRINGNFCNVTANFIEFEEKQKSDYDVIVNVTKDWEEGSFTNNTFLNSILADIDYRKRVNDSGTKTHIFALTKQDNNFKNVDKDRVLGVVEFSEGECTNTIDYLQVNPEYIERFDFQKDYKGIGSAILDSLKQLTDKSIDVDSAKSAKGFYEKNNFKNIYPVGNTYIWKK